MYDNIYITINGHTVPEVCAAVSSAMYTTVNAIAKYNRDCMEYIDDEVEDEVKIDISKPDKIINMLVDNMFDMFNDIYEDGNEDKIRINRR